LPSAADKRYSLGVAMTSMRKITARDKPETLARTAALHKEHLGLALGVALRRATRSKPLVRELLSRATFEGLAPKLNAKVAVVSFVVPQIKESWHQLIPWQHLASETPAETATTIAWSLRENIRRHKLSGTPLTKMPKGGRS
jgi:hypothetical protein